jgi:hypothetical protein
MACKEQKETRCCERLTLCCLRRKLLWPEVQSGRDTQRNTGLGHGPRKQHQLRNPTLHVRQETSSSTGESPTPGARIRASRLQDSSLSQAEPHRPEARPNSAPLRALGCKSAFEVHLMHVCPANAYPLPAGQHYPKSHACRNTEHCCHSLGWLGLTQGEIVQGLKGTNCS